MMVDLAGREPALSQAVVIPGERSEDPESIVMRCALRWIPELRGYAACPE
jgi:hypothetical protein